MQRILVFILLVVIVSSFIGVGYLGEPWNEFDIIVQQLGWGEESIVSPTSNAALSLNLIQIPGNGGIVPVLNIFENFEGGFNTWTNTGGDSNDCWRHRNTPTPTSFTGPSTGAAGSAFFVFYESSNGCSPGSGMTAFLLGPTIDFDAFSSVEITFWRHMWDGAAPDNMGKLALQLENPPGSGTFIEVWSQQGNQGNSWDQFTVDLSAVATTGGQREIRFVATEVVSGIHSDMAVDEITIQAAVTPNNSNINLITGCIFSSTDSIPSGTGLSFGKAICKLLDAPVDQGGVVIAEGKTFFEHYDANTDLEVTISSFAFALSNNNELIQDIQFIIEAPI